MADRSAREVAGGAGDLLRPLAVHLDVLIGSTELTLRDLLSLHPGALVVLDQEVDRPLAVRVEGVPLFLGRAYSSGGQFAVRILGPARGHG